MDVEDARERLQKLGMSAYEAKAYIALLQAGVPLNGYEVAKRSGVPRSTVYETLAKLVARGAAHEVSEGDGTSSYLPLPADALVGRLSRQFESSLAGLERGLHGLSAAPRARLVHTIDDARVLKGRAGDVIASAREELFVCAWPEDLVVLKPEIRACAERGVAVRSLSFGDDPEPLPDAIVHAFSAPEIVLRSFGGRQFIVAADRGQVVIGAFFETLAHGVYSDDPAVVALAVEYIQHDIAIQRMALHLGDERMKEIWYADEALQRLREPAGRSGQALGGA
jgi:sugar-specific transcriptional regulator TrmB